MAQQQHLQQQQQQQPHNNIPILLRQTPSKIFRPWDNTFHSTGNESTTNYMENRIPIHLHKPKQQIISEQLNNIFNNNNDKISTNFNNSTNEEEKLSLNNSVAPVKSNNNEEHCKNRIIAQTMESVEQLKNNYKISVNSNVPVTSPTNPIEMPSYFCNTSLDTSYCTGRIPIPFFPAISPTQIAAFNEFYQHHHNTIATTTTATTATTIPSHTIHLPNVRDSTIPPPISYEAFSLIEEEYVRVIAEEAQIKVANARKQRPKKFRCNHCNVAFANNGQLKGHLRIHTGERPYKCDTCSKTFTRNEELTRHKRIHTGLRPYPCTICGKKFGRRDHLKKHMKTHLPQERHQIPSSLLMSMYPYMYGYV